MSPIFSLFSLLHSASILPSTSRWWISDEAEDEDIDHRSDVLNKPWTYRRHLIQELWKQRFHNTILGHFQTRKRNKSVSLSTILKPASVEKRELIKLKLVGAQGEGSGTIHSRDTITCLSLLSTEGDGRRGLSWRFLFINPQRAQDPSARFVVLSTFILSLLAKWRYRRYRWCTEAHWPTVYQQSTLVYSSPSLTGKGNNCNCFVINMSLTGKAKCRLQTTFVKTEFSMKTNLWKSIFYI